MRNLKKILALVLALVMSLSLMAVAGADEDLNLGDVSEVYAESVDVLTGLKVFMGNKGEFLPKDNITRAEVAAIIYRIVTGDVTNTQNSIYADYNKFSDVTSDAWYAGYVNYCANAEYIKGKGFDANGKAIFKPQDNVTGYEALAMILRAIGYDKNNEFTGSNWQIQTAATARTRGILANIAEGTLGGPATREVVAEILCQTILVPMADYSLAFGYRTTDANGKDNENLAYKTFKMEKIEGVVLANEYAALDDTKPLAAGQTKLDTTAQPYTLNVASDLDDIGESRYVYVIPQSGTTRYDLVCSKVYDTGKNNVYDSGEAVTTVGDSTGKDNGITSIVGAQHFVNYEEITEYTTNMRLSYVIYLNWSEYDAKTMRKANGGHLYKLSVDSDGETVATEQTATGDPASWDRFVEAPATGLSYVYCYTKDINAFTKLDNGGYDYTNIRNIFIRADREDDGIVLGEVYEGTISEGATLTFNGNQLTVTGRDLSDFINWAAFVEKYLDGDDNKKVIDSNGLGNRLKIVDNNNDGVAEYVLQTIYTVAIVSNVDANGKISLDIMNADFDALADECHYSTSTINVVHSVAPNTHSVDSVNEITSSAKTAVYGDGEVSTGTVVLYAYIDGTAQMEPASGETVSFNKIDRTVRTATTTDSAEYKESAVHEHSTSLAHTVARLVTGTTYTVYFDKYGNLAAFTEGSNGEFTLLTDGWFNNTISGGEYAVRAWIDGSLQDVNVTSGGELFVYDTRYETNMNSWGNLRYFDRLNIANGRNRNDDNVHTTVAVLNNGILTPVDKVYLYNKQNAMIEMDNDVIPLRDNQTTSKGWVWNTRYGLNEQAYNQLADRADDNNTHEGQDRFDVRGLSTTKYYFVYNLRTNGNTITTVVREFTGYSSVPSVLPSQVEDVYAVGTRAVNAAGDTYYTADVVVVELNNNYNGAGSKQVFIPQFNVLTDTVDYVTLIDGDTGELRTDVPIDMRASDLRFYDAAGNIVTTRTGNVVPGLYYMDETDGTNNNGTYVIRWMDRTDIQNAGRYAVGFVSMNQTGANWANIDRLTYNSGTLTSAGEFARMSENVGHYYTLSYNAAGVASLEEDTSANHASVLATNPDDSRYDNCDSFYNEQSADAVIYNSTRRSRNEVLMAYSGNNVTYMVSFNEYSKWTNGSDNTHDAAQSVWARVMPESYNTTVSVAPSVTFYGYDKKTVTYSEAIGAGADEKQILVTRGQDNSIDTVTVISAKKTDGTDIAATVVAEKDYHGNNTGNYYITVSPEVDGAIYQIAITYPTASGRETEIVTLTQNAQITTLGKMSNTAGKAGVVGLPATQVVDNGTINVGVLYNAVMTINDLLTTGLEMDDDATITLDPDYPLQGTDNVPVPGVLHVIVTLPGEYTAKVTLNIATAYAFSQSYIESKGFSGASLNGTELEDGQLIPAGAQITLTVGENSVTVNGETYIPGDTVTAEMTSSDEWLDDASQDEDSIEDILTSDSSDIVDIIDAYDGSDLYTEEELEEIKTSEAYTSAMRSLVSAKKALAAIASDGDTTAAEAAVAAAEKELKLVLAKDVTIADADLPEMAGHIAPLFSTGITVKVEPAATEGGRGTVYVTGRPEIVMSISSLNGEDDTILKALISWNHNGGESPCTTEEAEDGTTVYVCHSSDGKAPERMTKTEAVTFATGVLTGLGCQSGDSLCMMFIDCAELLTPGTENAVMAYPMSQTAWSALSGADYIAPTTDYSGAWGTQAVNIDFSGLTW